MNRFTRARGAYRRDSHRESGASNLGAVPHNHTAFPRSTARAGRADPRLRPLPPAHRLPKADIGWFATVAEIENLLRESGIDAATARNVDAGS